MSTTTIRYLAQHASEVVHGVEDSGRPAIVTRNGSPVAAVIPIDPERLEDYILASAPSFVGDMAAADRDLAAGRVVPADDLFRELEG